jgi:serine/threonine protein kinase
LSYQLLLSLAHLNSLNLVHCDIKPENILMESYGGCRCKVIDFGSGCFEGDWKSGYVQSRSYRAPEVICGLDWSHKVDVWSLGCVLFELFTTQVLFTNSSVPTMLARMQSLCGNFPKWMLGEGKEVGRFFTKAGIVYEEIDEEDEGDWEDDEIRLMIHSPVPTTFEAVLGFDEANATETERR